MNYILSLIFALFESQEVHLTNWFISGRIIAMGFPSENVESIYRNSMDDVKRLLEERHKVSKNERFEFI